MSGQSIAAQCRSLREYLRGFQSHINATSRGELRKAVDVLVGLVDAELTIREGGLEEQIKVIKKLIPRGSRVHTLKKIASVRNRNIRSFYPRDSAASKKPTVKPPRSAGSTGVAVAHSSGAGARQSSRTQVLKKQITKSTNGRFTSDQTTASDEELAERITLILHKRNSATGEDPQVAIRRIAALAESKLAASRPGIGANDSA